MGEDIDPCDYKFDAWRDRQLEEEAERLEQERQKDK